MVMLIVPAIAFSTQEEQGESLEHPIIRGLRPDTMARIEVSTSLNSTSASHLPLQYRGQPSLNSTSFSFSSPFPLSFREHQLTYFHLLSSLTIEQIDEDFEYRYLDVTMHGDLPSLATKSPWERPVPI
jgi:hypothetical protein